MEFVHVIGVICMYVKEMEDLLLNDKVPYAAFLNRYHDKYERSDAVEKINNEKALIRIARNDPVDYVVMLAARKIHNQKVLKELVLSNREYYVRRDALENIRDDEFLFSIAKLDYSSDIRGYAVKSIRNQEMLIHIVENNNFIISARRNAIRNIADEDKLIYYALKYENFRLAAIQNPHLKDEETLIDFAKYDDSYDVRLAALKKLDSQELFIDVAFHDAKLRSHAANQINSKNVLRELIKNYGVGSGRFKEISKMSRYKQLQLIKDEK